ncbi:MAG: tRNA 2-thiouridine(34) synthase MnmA [Deltaproteobacteria bacterium]|nr:tRNA 2-thiouridine(34) synthase MnmA [Deltaproteobacteria bacterium]
MKVLCAMSGGVDSSVAALLLKQQGHEVIGVSMKLREMPMDPSLKVSGCCSLEDFNDARRVCDALEIPFYALNFKEQFNEKVVDVFASEYLRGRTPNPCVLCNRDIKFDALLAKAEEMGAQSVATGHYARIQKTGENYQLLRGLDSKKDQSYFLFSLGQKELSKMMFPVGHLTKPQVREIAREYNLKTKDKPESMEICFVPNDDPGAFLDSYIAEGRHPPPGDYIDLSGKVIGKHEGIHKYTIGQRRGINLSMGKRFYVQKINPETNQITLAEDRALYQNSLLASKVGWIGSTPALEEWMSAKIRYRTEPADCQIQALENGDYQINFKEAQRAITPGQALVFYRGDEVLGGGWIERGL